MAKCSIAIKIRDRKQLYTNGDVVSGTVVITVHEEVNIEAIDIKLRCNEVARVRYSTGQTTSIDEKKIKRVNERVLLFPTHELSASSAKSHQIRKGNHQFDFTFVIPHGPSASIASLITNSCNSRVEWYLKVVMRRPAMLSRNLRESNALVFHPLHIIPDTIRNAVKQFRSELIFRAHLEGCKTGLSRMFGDSDHRKDTKIAVISCIPVAGIAQSPRPLGIRLMFDCPDPDLILIRDIHINLKSVTRIRASYHSASKKHTHCLLKISGAIISLSSPKDMAALDRRLADLKLEPLLAPNFTSECFHLSYTLTIDVVFMSKHLRDHSRKLSLSLPIRVQSRSIGPGNGPGMIPDDTPLPLYSEVEGPRPVAPALPSKKFLPVS